MDTTVSSTVSTSVARDITVSSTVSTSVARDTTVSSTMSTTVASGLGNLVLEPRPYFMLQYIILRERT